MSVAWNRTTRPRVLLPLLVLGLVAAGLAPPAAAGKPNATVKGYTATATPSVVPLPLPAGGVSVALRLRNSSGSQSFASAELRVPAGTGLNLALASVTRSGWSVGAAATVGNEVVVQLVSAGTGTTNAIQPGQAIDVGIPVRAIEGPVTMRTAVKQSNDFSGSGNEFTRSGADPTVYIGAGPAVGLEFVQQASTVQRTAGTTPTYLGLSPVLSMCPAPSVRVVDQNGTTVRAGAARTVTLAATAAGLGGTPEATTVDGVATFGTCVSGVTASTLGTGLVATASTTGLPDRTSTSFDVRPVYGSCPGDCSVPELTGGQGTTSASVQGRAATGASAADRLTFGVASDTWSAGDLGACDPDPETTNGANPYRDVVTVDLSNHDKTVTLRWSKKAVQWATNNGSSQWQVCLAAAASFAAVGGSSELVDGWYVGALLRCGDPALAAADPCVASLRRNGGEQLATVSIPDRDGDPRMI